MGRGMATALGLHGEMEFSSGVYRTIDTDGIAQSGNISWFLLQALNVNSETKPDTPTLGYF